MFLDKKAEEVEKKLLALSNMKESQNINKSLSNPSNKKKAKAS